MLEWVELDWVGFRAKIMDYTARLHVPAAGQLRCVAAQKSPQTDFELIILTQLAQISEIAMTIELRPKKDYKRVTGAD